MAWKHTQAIRSDVWIWEQRLLAVPMPLRADVLIEQLQADPAIAAADTLLLTIPNQLGFEENLSIISNFAKYVAPELGWIPADQGPVTG